MDLTAPSAPRVAYGFYPVVAGVTVAGLWAALASDLDRNAVVGVLTAVTIAIAFVVERRHPLLSQWEMTRASFVGRDLPFIGLGLVVQQVAQAVVGLVAAATLPAGGFGPLARLPLVAQVVAGLVLFDLLWYGYHRAAHTWERLWRVHGVHHAPEQVYLLMHPVFHPLDLVASRLVLPLLVFRCTGLAPDAVFVVLVVLNLQQTVSHMNVDVRTGWLGHVLVGTQTHRLHHSADPREGASNFSSAITVWDKLFGTFLYTPGRLPQRLGLTDPDAFVDVRQFHRALVYPFRRGVEG